MPIRIFVFLISMRSRVFQVELFLFDVSMSGVFAMVYGALLILAGLVIGKKSRPESFAELRTMDRQRLAVFSFAICVVSSGFFCFALDKEWMSGLSTAVKIPMYMVLGTSFSVVDTVNTGCCSPDEADGGERFTRAIVSSPSQIYAILSGSIAMGAVFGFMFGYLDVEDDDWKLVRFSNDQVLWFRYFPADTTYAGLRCWRPNPSALTLLRQWLLTSTRLD